MARCPYCDAEINELIVDMCKCRGITYAFRLDDKGEVTQEEIDRDEEPEVVDVKAYCPECDELLPFKCEDEIEAFLRGEIVLIWRDDPAIGRALVVRNVYR